MLLILHDVYAMYNLFRTAFDTISADLREKLDALTSEVKNLPSTVVPHGNAPDPFSGPSSIGHASLLALLAKAKPLPRLEPGDFKGLQHWFPKNYRALRKKAKTEDGANEDVFDDLGTVLDAEQKPEPKKKAVTLCCFLEDKNGNPIPETDKTAILATAASFWSYLVGKGKAPRSYRHCDVETRSLWRVLMESNFECVRYCDNYWKLDQIWINYYPSWIKTVCKQEQKAKEAAADDVIDIEDNDDNNSNGTGDTGEDAEITKNNTNKRGPPDGGETSKSKRPRAKEPEKSTPSDPASPKTTTKHPRVCLSYFSTIFATNNV